ncbi:MAG: spore maturation protein [Oscillospiraceae bacterium]|nr:spore maturation protein [Oscillospiraceae bacterium]
MTAASFVIPAMILLIIAWGMYKRVDVFSEFAKGAAENLRTCAELLPTLIALITAVGMFRASGAEDLLIGAFSGFFERIGFPAECLPLALIRPVSGSGALAVYESLLEQSGPDSFAGRVASVMLGSTETTFYTLAVYYGAVGIKKTRHTLSASLAGDMTGFIVSVLTVNIFFGHI